MQEVVKLKNILKTKGKITILGHDNIDVDAFVSGILLSNLLNFLGIKNEFLILEKIKENETYNIVKEMFGIDMKKYYSKVEDTSRKLFLVDHYSTGHSGKVIACLDHHLSDDVVVNGYPFYYSRISCSTSFLVYELMKKVRYVISKEEANMILVSMMIDTVSFRSEKTVKSEVVEAKKISEQYNLDYEKIEKYCLCLTPINNLSVEQIINNGYKYYEYYGKKVKSSYIQVYEGLNNEQIQNFIEEITRRIKLEKLDMWVFIVFECKDEITYEYQITQVGVENVKSDCILSRGTNIMPKIERKLKNSKKIP